MIPKSLFAADRRHHTCLHEGTGERERERESFIKNNVHNGVAVSLRERERERERFNRYNFTGPDPV